MIDAFSTQRIHIVLNRDSESTYSVSLYSLIDDRQEHIRHLSESEARRIFYANVRYHR